MDPIDYTSAFANLPSAQDAMMAGLKNGLGLQELEMKRQQEEAAVEQQRAMQAELAEASRDHSRLPAVMIKYPQLAEKLKHGWDAKTGEQQRADLGQATEVYSALKAGRKDIAVERLRGTAEAYRNSGDTVSAKRMEDMAQWAEMDPVSMMNATATRIAALPGGDKVIEGVAKLDGNRRAQELQGDLVRKGAADANAAESDATAKGVAARYAEQGVLLDLEKKGWDIKALKADMEFKREANRIAAINAAANREGNALKRDELKLRLQEAQTAFDDKVRGKVADAESAAGNMDNMLNTIKRIEKNPSLNSVLGSLEGKAYYPNAVLGTLNPGGDGDERADAIALIETLGSQAFLSQIPNIKGMGALSNAEGEKLQAAFQNLSRAQSEKQFKATLQEATRLLEKGRNTVSKRFGVPLGAPDTPAAATTPSAAGGRPPLSSFQR